MLGFLSSRSSPSRGLCWSERICSFTCSKERKRRDVSFVAKYFYLHCFVKDVLSFVGFKTSMSGRNSQLWVYQTLKKNKVISLRFTKIDPQLI